MTTTRPGCVRVRLRVEGIVQGVGFRPFVHALASRLGLAGFVGSDARGVLVEIEGEPGAVAALRSRKHREDKPFAVMVADLAAAAALCEVGEAEARVLAGPRRPVVLLPRRAGAPVAGAVAPGNRSLGLMLPYAEVLHRGRRALRAAVRRRAGAGRPRPASRVPVDQVRDRPGRGRADRRPAPPRPRGRLPGRQRRDRPGHRGGVRRARLRHRRHHLGRRAAPGRSGRVRAAGALRAGADAGRRRGHPRALAHGSRPPGRGLRRPGPGAARGGAPQPGPLGRRGRGGPGGRGLAAHVERGLGLALVDLGHREADVDEHPVARLQRLALQQPDGETQPRQRERQKIRDAFGDASIP